MTVIERARRATRRFLGSALLAAAAFFLGWCGAPVGSERTAEDRPASRPASAPADAAAGSGPAHGEPSSVWTCSMHPQVRRSSPGDCPICGMELVRASSEDRAGRTPGASEGGAGLRLSERARRLARIETAEVELGVPKRSRRLFGRLELDETRLHAVTAWVSGRIERLRVATTGEVVRRGQIVAELYSPEVYAAQRDLRIAVRQLAALEDAEGSARAAARKAVDASRRRLELLGVPEAEVDAMAQDDEPPTRVAVRSTVGGTVLQRRVTEGQYVKTGEPLYRVADLSSLWVQLEAHASELSELSVGDPVRLRVPALPGLDLEGRVRFLDPTVDRDTRVARVRIEVPNGDGRLRPGMYVEASVVTKGSEERALVVPESAVLFTGRRSLVYVEERRPDGPVYRPRVVEVGALLDGFYVISAGLSPGERVVVEGAFVLDADLQIEGGPSAMSRELHADPHWTSLVEGYVDLARALAADRLDGAQDAAQRMKVASRQLDAPWAARIEDTVSKIEDASDLDAARSELERVVERLRDGLRARGNPLAVPLHVVFCPMVGGDRGGSWLQTSEEVDNPYFGAAMRRCGELRQTVGPGARP